MWSCRPGACQRSGGCPDTRRPRRPAAWQRESGSYPPISAMIATAVVCPMQGMVSSSATASAMGASASQSRWVNCASCCFDEVDMGEHVAEQHAVLGLDAPLQRLTQLREALLAAAHAPTRPTTSGRCSPARIASSISRPLLPSTSVATAPSLMFAPLQQLVQPVDLLRPLLDQRLPVARQLAQGRGCGAAE